MYAVARTSSARWFADLLFVHGRDNEKVRALVERVRVYNAKLHQYGLKDYQVADGFGKISKRLLLLMILRRLLYLVCRFLLKLMQTKASKA